MNFASDVSIAPATKSTVSKTLQNPTINDFEDGLEYYAALEHKCDCSVTEDINDFYFSQIEVLKSEAFFDQIFSFRKKCA